jgi:hypothetical protein
METQKPNPTLHIIVTETGNEPHAIRSAAEWWQYDVTMSWVGNSQQIVDYLSSKPKHDLIIFSTHGIESGMALPELDPEIEKNYPYVHVITPDDFDHFVNLDNNTVINLSCVGGKNELAKVFLAHGAKFYIGDIGYQYGTDSLMFCLDMIYYISKGKDVEEAFQIASQHLDPRQQFKLFKHENI